MTDRDRIRSVVEEYERPLCRYAARIVGDIDRARDIVQDTFLRFCKKGESLDDDSVAPWLYRVCRNRALDIVRKDKPMKRLSEKSEARIESRGPDPAAAAQKKDTLSHVQEALAELPEQQEEAVRLKFEHGMSYRQIAGVLDTSESNVGYLIHVGIKTMRARLAAL